mmetsp:Transcript_21932/g.36340  ORF Transcript_21932/g.36340 Transcript_21932/m.36340 type:complete len:140 (-) Transcript_21932:166-585(-)
MPYSRFVQIGRVVLINYGPDAGKLAVIIDVIDQNRCLIDGPFARTGVMRQQIPFKRLSLTNIVVDVTRQARTKNLCAAFDKAEVASKWATTSWAKKIAAKTKRASSTDFERFKLMLAKKKRTSLVNKEFAKLKKEQLKK